MKIIRIILKKISSIAVHKCDRDIVYEERKKCGYSRMVKFLFAKEKTRVRFPLSAQGNLFLFI